jgi:hypothetical protein
LEGLESVWTSCGSTCQICLPHPYSGPVQVSIFL